MTTYDRAALEAAHQEMNRIANIVVWELRQDPDKYSEFAKDLADYTAAESIFREQTQAMCDMLAARRVA